MHPAEPAPRRPPTGVACRDSRQTPRAPLMRFCSLQRLPARAALHRKCRFRAFPLRPSLWPLRVFAADEGRSLRPIFASVAAAGHSSRIHCLRDVPDPPRGRRHAPGRARSEARQRSWDFALRSFHPVIASPAAFSFRREQPTCRFPRRTPRHFFRRGIGLHESMENGGGRLSFAAPRLLGFPANSRACAV